MSKKLLSLSVAVLLMTFTVMLGMAPEAYALFGLEKHWASVYDTEGNVRTDITTVTVYNAGTTTVATVYADDSATALTNPIVSGISDGVFEFWTAATSVDVLVSDGVSAKLISGMTNLSPHRILLTEQIGEQKTIRFTIGDFIGIQTVADGAAIIPLRDVGDTDWATGPSLEIQNNLPAIIWEDGWNSYAQVTFRVPPDYISGGLFKVFTDFDTSTAPSIKFKVYVNSDGSAWDTTHTAQTAVDQGGTAGSPKLVTLTPATDFASLAANDVVTFAIGRDDVDVSTGDLELYYVDFYYNGQN